jgi:drug/metabolite transporter (DMT)-like permease
MKPFLLTTLAMIAFAANSVLCKLGLGAGAIDPASYTAIRIASGAIMLVAITLVTKRDRAQVLWLAPVALSVYAVALSFAYVSLKVGTGALILFGSVQVTMITAALLRGEKPRIAEWIGLAMAFGGLVYLVLPGLSAPSPVGSALMAAAGASWGIYTLLGKRASDPVLGTTANFLFATPLVAIAALFSMGHWHFTTRGVVMAITSGAVTSGLGYVIWYQALAYLSATRAALVQLSVPVIASAGGVIFLSEALSARMVIASALILGGIAFSVVFKQMSKPQPTTSDTGAIPPSVAE